MRSLLFVTILLVSFLLSFSKPSVASAPDIGIWPNYAPVLFKPDDKLIASLTTSAPLSVTTTYIGNYPINRIHSAALSVMPIYINWNDWFYPCGNQAECSICTTIKGQQVCSPSSNTYSTLRDYIRPFIQTWIAKGGIRKIEVVIITQNDSTHNRPGPTFLSNNKASRFSDSDTCNQFRTFLRTIYNVLSDTIKEAANGDNSAKSTYANMQFIFSIGNEINLHIPDIAGFEQYKIFYEDALSFIKNGFREPSGTSWKWKFGVGVSMAWADDLARMGADAFAAAAWMNEKSDYIIVTYYPYELIRFFWTSPSNNYQKPIEYPFTSSVATYANIRYHLGSMMGIQPANPMDSDNPFASTKPRTWATHMIKNHGIVPLVIQEVGYPQQGHYYVQGTLDGYQTDFISQFFVQLGNKLSNLNFPVDSVMWWPLFDYPTKNTSSNLLSAPNLGIYLMTHNKMSPIPSDSACGTSWGFVPPFTQLDMCTSGLMTITDDFKIYATKPALKSLQNALISLR